MIFSPLTAPADLTRPGVCATLVLVSLTCWSQTRSDELKSVAPSCAASSTATRLPGPPAVHRYQVQGRTRSLAYSATATMSWQPEANKAYTMNYDIRAFLGLGRQQTSTGRWSTDGLSPRQFTEPGSRRPPLTVDAQRGTVQLPEAPTEQALVSGSQDKLSAWSQLGWWVVCSTPTFEKPAALAMPVWGSGDTEKWTIQSLGWVKIDTPYGERNAIHLVRPAGMGGDSRIELWYVPEWGVLPVRLRIEQPNGDRADQQLSERQPSP